MSFKVDKGADRTFPFTYTENDYDSIVLTDGLAARNLAGGLLVGRSWWQKNAGENPRLAEVVLDVCRTTTLEQDRGKVEPSYDEIFGLVIQFARKTLGVKSCALVVCRSGAFFFSHAGYLKM